MSRKGSTGWLGCLLTLIACHCASYHYCSAFMLPQHSFHSVCNTKTKIHLLANWPKVGALTGFRRYQSSGNIIDGGDYRYYFAYGSNMLPETLRSLRNVQPIDATAAFLPDYELCFTIPGIPWLEPSSACVRAVCEEPDSGSNTVSSRQFSGVHGVLYTLTPKDFAQVSRTEGVPWVYRWKSIEVIPYCHPQKATKVTAETLIAAATKNSINQRDNDGDNILPSPSYLRILQQGAAYWRMDAGYQFFLRDYPTSKNNLLLRDGLAGAMLDAAMVLNPKRKQ